MHNSDLASFFNSLSDEELTSRAAGGGLTDIAQKFAETEMASRKLPIPVRPVSESSNDENYRGDMVILERGLNPTDAHILCSLLQSAGISADAGDTNLVQTNALLSIAVGGVRIRVPAAQLADATELLAAYKRGDFALGDDFNAGDAAASQETSSK